MSRNVPCVIRGGCSHWPAVTKWTPKYLAQLAGQLTVSVEATPDGRGQRVGGQTMSSAHSALPPTPPPPTGDAIATDSDGQRVFVLPESQRWRFADFLSLMEARGSPSTCPTNHDRPGVFYLSHQNGNLLAADEFGQVLAASGDIELEHAFAREALGAAPDAVNFWMGRHDAVTTLHKDPYDNIYSVIAGTKIFTIFPPSDAVFLTEELLPVRQYEQSVADGSFKVCGWWGRGRRWRCGSSPLPLLQMVPYVDGTGESLRPWLANDPVQPDFDQHPRQQHAHPYTVRVEAGDVLYLPALWYHHVQQEGEPCIAVNTWCVRYAAHVRLAHDLLLPLHHPFPQGTTWPTT